MIELTAAQVLELSGRPANSARVIAVVEADGSGIALIDPDGAGSRIVVDHFTKDDNGNWQLAERSDRTSRPVATRSPAPNRFGDGSTW